MDELPYPLAYDASVRAIEDQARVLEDVRSRAATLVAAAALVTGFLGQEALTRASALEPVSWNGLAVALFVATAGAAFLVLWPVHVRFSLSATEILAILRARQAVSEPVESVEALTEIATRLELMYDENSSRVRFLLWAFRASIVFLSLEVAGLGGGAVEALMAKKPDNGTPRPQPQWPDISKPDTRGGG